jgi:TP53 regulating kinase-like protein
MEWVEGWSVREVLGGGAEGEEEEDGELEMREVEGTRTPAEEVMEQLGLSVGELRRIVRKEAPLTSLWSGTAIHAAELMTSIGTALAKLHTAQIIHGDLTTSNMMLRPKPNSQPNYELVRLPFSPFSTFCPPLLMKFTHSRSSSTLASRPCPTS